MGGNVSYNQVYITEEDTMKIALQCLKAMKMFKCVIMLFRLKNLDAPHQRVMITIFHDKTDKLMEVYIDNVVIKVDSYKEHIYNLRQAFD